MKIDKRTEDIELRANSEAELLAALPSELKQGAGVNTGIHNWTIDWDIEVKNSQEVVSDKFHANLRLLRGYTMDIPSQFKINSVTPSRVFSRKE